MVAIHIAYTAPINPQGASPVLTNEQVWKGLQRKIRKAYEFVAVIKECNVLEEKNEGKEVIREVRFEPGFGPPGMVKERCVEFEPTKVDFHQENGSTITNIISKGPSGTAEDLHMTYVFEFLHPEAAADSSEAEDLYKKYSGGAKMAVDKSIEAIRRMVTEGVIV